MKQKPIIHMYRAGDKIPFDVAPYRAIQFSYVHPDELEAAKTALKDAVEEVLKPGFQVENPVTRARGFEKLEEHATPEQKLVLQQLQSMEFRLAAIERRSSPRTRGSYWENDDIIVPKRSKRLEPTYVLIKEKDHQE
jgi:hypothetical protein